MRPPYAAIFCYALALLFITPAARSQDSKTKDALEKLIIEAKKSAGKLQDSGDKGNSLWSRSKETLALPKEEYLKRADSAMKSMDAEIKALGEAEGAVSAREYFKIRTQSLKQHLAHCRLEHEKLKSSDSDETFRVKQKKFDRTLVFLAENIQLAKEEAGL